VLDHAIEGIPNVFTDSSMFSPCHIGIIKMLQCKQEARDTQVHFRVVLEL
jgi:hypothetical protein